VQADHPVVESPPAAGGQLRLELAGRHAGSAQLRAGGDVVLATAQLVEGQWTGHAARVDSRNDGIAQLSTGECGPEFVCSWGRSGGLCRRRSSTAAPG
jgi:hypothetical protein